MSQTLAAPNFPRINIVQQTALTADTPAASNSLPVQNNYQFITGDFFILGTLTTETSELLTVSNPTGDNVIVPTTNTGFAHTNSEPVTKLFGSQIRVYSAPDTLDHTPPADSAFSLIGTVNIWVDSASTDYTDPVGSSAYWYKFTYYNPTTTAETDLSASDAVRGGNIGYYCSVDDIRAEAGFNNSPFITDSMINKKRLNAQNEIDSTLSDAFTVPFTAPIPPMINGICIRLAAGLLLMQKYTYSTNLDTNGTNRVTGARAELLKLQTGNTPVVDANGKNIGLPNPNTSASGWPNETTSSSPRNEGGAHRAFRMSDVEGYYSRKF